MSVQNAGKAMVVSCGLSMDFYISAMEPKCCHETSSPQAAEPGTGGTEAPLFGEGWALSQEDEWPPLLSGLQQPPACASVFLHLGWAAFHSGTNKSAILRGSGTGK